MSSATLRIPKPALDTEDPAGRRGSNPAGVSLAAENGRPTSAPSLSVITAGAGGGAFYASWLHRRARGYSGINPKLNEPVRDHFVV
jgi:hypothetical protein